MRLYKRKSRGRESENWSFYHKEEGADGCVYTWRESLRTVDEKLARRKAEKILNDWRKEQAAEALGVVTHAQTRHEPLPEIIGDYIRTLRGQRITERQVQLVAKRICRIFEEAAAGSIAELTPELLRATLDRLERLPNPSPKKNPEPEEQDQPPKALTARTLNRYLQAVGSFYRWLIREGRWDKNPADAVQRRKEVEEKPRYALSLDELEAFLENAPRHRRLVYFVASTGGLRRKELETLRWSDVNLQDGTVTVFAKRAKNRKAVTLPLPKPVMAEWKRYRKDPEAFMPEDPRKVERESWGARLSSGLALPPIPTPDTVRRDMERAGIVLDEEHRYDLHSLRTSCGTSLSRSGVKLEVAQEMMRHSDPRLTRAIYIRLGLEDRREAAGALEKAMKKAKARAKRKRKSKGA